MAGLEVDKDVFGNPKGEYEERQAPLLSESNGEKEAGQERRWKIVSAAEKVFAEGVAKDIRAYLPPEYADMECRVTERRKNNGVVLTGICFTMPGQQLSPLIYVEPFYEAARRGEPLGGIMESFARAVEKGMAVKNLPGFSSPSNYETVKDYLTVQLVNTKANRCQLSDVPHREMADLSLIPVLRVAMPEAEGNGSIRVTQELLSKWGVSEQELYRQAWENMDRDQAPVLQSMRTVAEEIEMGTASDENLLAGTETAALDPEEMLYVLSNKERTYGAAVLACPGVLEKVSRLFPEGFYILPSSLHEVLIVPEDKGFSQRELGQVVRDVNREAVAKEEVLSDHIYRYDRERQKICQVPESMEKRGMER